jgi:hypothetical protein
MLAYKVCHIEYGFISLNYNFMKIFIYIIVSAFVLPSFVLAYGEVPIINTTWDGGATSISVDEDGTFKVDTSTDDDEDDADSSMEIDIYGNVKVEDTEDDSDDETNTQKVEFNVNKNISNSKSSDDSDDSDDTLEVLIEEEIEADTSLEDVSFSENTMEIKYKAPGRFLWVFPMKVTYTILVGTNDKSVSVKVPWWSVFVRGKEKTSNVETAIKNKLEVDLSGIIVDDTGVSIGGKSGVNVGADGGVSIGGQAGVNISNSGDINIGDAVKIKTKALESVQDTLQIQFGN